MSFGDEITGQRNRLSEADFNKWVVGYLVTLEPHDVIAFTRALKGEASTPPDVDMRSPPLSLESPGRVLDVLPGSQAQSSQHSDLPSSQASSDVLDPLLIDPVGIFDESGQKAAKEKALENFQLAWSRLFNAGTKNAAAMTLLTNYGYFHRGRQEWIMQPPKWRNKFPKVLLDVGERVRKSGHVQQFWYYDDDFYGLLWLCRNILEHIDECEKTEFVSRHCHPHACKYVADYAAAHKKAALYPDSAAQFLYWLYKEIDRIVEFPDPRESQFVNFRHVFNEVVRKYLKFKQEERARKPDVRTQVSSARGRGVLHRALLEFADPDDVQRLVENGADTEWRDKDGSRPVDWANYLLADVTLIQHDREDKKADVEKACRALLDALAKKEAVAPPSTTF